LAELPQNAVQRWPFDQLHRVVVGAALLAGGIDGHDVGVVKLRRPGRLAAEALDGLPRQAQAGAEDFERDMAAQRGLHRLVDDAHAAAAQLADQLELAQPRTGQLSHRRTPFAPEGGTRLILADGGPGRNRLPSETWDTDLTGRE